MPKMDGHTFLRRLSALDRDSALDRVAKLVECDQALTARVLQLGRTAMYASSRPDQDLKTTIARLGLQTPHAVVETV